MDVIEVSTGAIGLAYLEYCQFLSKSLHLNRSTEQAQLEGIRVQGTITNRQSADARPDCGPPSPVSNGGQRRGAL